MTRHGSLAYYLAAWVCGSFFMSLAIWLRDLAGPTVGFISFRSAFGFFIFYFYGLLLGVVSALLGGLLLRRIAVLAKFRDAWQWVLTGAILAPVLMLILGSFARSAAIQQTPLPGWLNLISFGPSVVLEAGLWLAAPAGAATAWVLYRVHRAFAMPAETTEAN
ncbi:MAG TPA: hypothetical protein VMV59_04160 [Candidatus Dormibacteraeota bacterium]|nr:hypothetical protein [Candidatus Dormibacteraeota bacterium]